jgi:succinate dehydrogenase/fumarate reductase-like Fe-S protein
MSNIKLMVTRGDKDKGKSMVEYQVPFMEGMSLLDALFWVREHVDPTLSVRYSCRSANACKECMAVVDGKVGYLCTLRAKEKSSVTIEPLHTRPWGRDLATLID